MYCLIAAETAIFTIFVVAYIFYIGKSLTGTPAARCAACSDLLDDLSAFEQPDDSLRREVAEDRESGLLRLVVASDNRSGSGLPCGHVP